MEKELECEFCGALMPQEGIYKDWDICDECANNPNRSESYE